MIIDRDILHDYKAKLEGYAFSFYPANHPLNLAPLEAWFGNIQREMKTELTARNLRRYVDYWNYERPHSALDGLTPSCAYLCGSEERFNFFKESAMKENRRELLTEVKQTVKASYN